jgi:hypothetical protein
MCGTRRLRGTASGYPLVAGYAVTGSSTVGRGGPEDRISPGWRAMGRGKSCFAGPCCTGRRRLRSCPRVFTSEKLARIEAPTLLVLGEPERIYRARQGRACCPAAHAVGAGQADSPRASRRCDRHPKAVNACSTAFLGEQRDTGPFARSPEVRFGPDGTRWRRTV